MPENGQPTVTMEIVTDPIELAKARAQRARQIHVYCG